MQRGIFAHFFCGSCHGYGRHLFIALSARLHFCFFVLAIKPSPDWNGTRSVFRPKGGMEAKAGTMESG